MAINGKLLRALIDTGSQATLLSFNAVNKLGTTLNKQIIIPNLTAVNGAPLRVLGAAWLEIAIGYKKIAKQWVPVVPDRYLSTDILLGVDILHQAPFYWDAMKDKIQWGGANYPAQKERMERGKVQKVTKVVKKEIDQSHTRVLRLTANYVIPPYQNELCQIKVNEAPGSILYVEPLAKAKQVSYPYITRVSHDRYIVWPINNSTPNPRKVKVGTCVGNYCTAVTVEATASEVSEVTSKVNLITEWHNDLVAPTPDIPLEGDRKQKLNQLLEQGNWQHLNEEQKKLLFATVLAHDQAFILEKDELGKIKLPPAEITLTNSTPARSPLYRYPVHAKEIIEKMVTDMEDKGIIEPSTAAWLSPIVLVGKPDGSKRLCLDYRKVNQHIAADIYPLPRLEELVEVASGNKYYVTLDLKDAYHQVELAQDSRDVTTFTEGTALYRFRRLPFGLSCSPGLFTRQINNVLAPLKKKGWTYNYLDDVIVVAPDFSTLMARLAEVFTKFIEMGIKLNLKKCHFGQEEVKFLGHIISENGSKPDPKNVDAITHMKAPKNIKEVRRFLGMTGFYRKFVPSYACLALPLTNLAKKEVDFVWTEDCQSAFEQLKEKLISAPVLVKAQMDRTFILTTDASKHYVGAVLSQGQDDDVEAVIGYFSKKLKPAEVKYSTTDREALAIVLACRNFSHFLWGSHFIVRTDHQPLTSVFKRKTKSPRMNRWIVEMRDYHYNIQYVKGKNNVVADQLSRPVRIIQHQIEEENWLGKTKEEFRDLQLQVPKWREMIEYLEGGRIPRHKYPQTTLEQFVMEEGVLFKVIRKIDNSLHYVLVVPHCLKQQALKLTHCTLSGHLGVYKTLTKVQNFFYWENVPSDVRTFVKRCLVCQQHKSSPGLQQQWQELPPVSKPLDRVSVDVMDLVAGCQGYRYVLTLLDHYSRYVVFRALKTKTTEEVSVAFKTYLTHFGVPHSLLSDNGGEFTSAQFKDLCRTHNIKLAYTTPYHPQGNSLTERMHRTVKAVLRTLCQGHPNHWPRMLEDTQIVMNQAVHSTTGQQPYFAFFSRHAPRLISSELPYIAATSDELPAAHEVLKKTHLNMARRFRAVANRRRVNQRVEVGDLVWVKLEVGIPGTCSKLNARWEGPYRVSEVIRGGSAYRLINLFTHTELQRAAEKVKPYVGEEQWLEEPQVVFVPEEQVEETLPPRQRRPPRYLIDEM